jgi:GT2 family glycosyltransferase
LIPVLISPLYNGLDLHKRMLRSVDEPIGRLLIIDNAKTGYSVYENLDCPNVRVWQPPFVSLGYAGSINFGILQTPDAPWWMWTNHDVVYGPGDLSVIAKTMDEAPGPMHMGGYCWGTVNREWVKVAGLLYEEFYPLYFDDTEYSHHVRSLGLEITPYNGEIKHGTDQAKASLTISSDERLRQANHTTFPANQRRYVEMWGGLPGHEIYAERWNGQKPPPPDLDHRALADRLWSGRDTRE